MRHTSISRFLWGERAKLRYLIIASVILLFAGLGGRDLWTQEHRWADIVTGMFLRHDFFHPYLGTSSYYDKPLLSYWLMAGVSTLTGHLNTWALRFPSALAGLVAIGSLYRLGVRVRNRQTGFLAGWLLLTTYFFLFWARTSSADMLNLAGSVLAVAWYVEKRDSGGFYNFACFFMILALTSLCKGLVGAIVPVIAVSIDVVLRNTWRRYLNMTFVLSMLPALIVYLSPFVASSLTGRELNQENGLYFVYRENILRYFQPFDHQGPIYTYLIYLPLYLFPWVICFIPAVWSVITRWRSQDLNARWIAWTVLSLFLFFTLSGSRRSYYVLPMVPFAILLTADWLQSSSGVAQRCLARGGAVVVSLLALMLLAVDVVPAWYSYHYGLSRFADVLKREAGALKPWDNWQIVMIDADTKLNFYLGLPPSKENLSVPGSREDVSMGLFRSRWPILTQKHDNTIFITRLRYVSYLEPMLTGYQMVGVPSRLPAFMNGHERDEPIAFVPGTFAFDRIKG